MGACRWVRPRQTVRMSLIYLAFERAAYASKSFIIALALCRGHLTAEQASQASHVEVRSQIEIWGEVEDSQSLPMLRKKC
jgi:chaperone required for assembly of F1-ATPase